MTKSKLKYFLLVCSYFLSAELPADQMPPEYFNAVVALGHTEVQPLTREVKWVTEASGFFYGYLVKDDPEPLKRQYKVFLVTNRHVLQSHTQIEVRLNPVKLTDKIRSFTLPLKSEQNNPLWVSHPDEKVDVSVYPIAFDYLVAQGIETNFIAGDSNSFTVAQMKNEGFAAGDGVFILGFPMGLSGEERNYVITRKGSVARITDLFMGVQTTFLIDAFIFPGNSGGPVIAQAEAIGIEGTKVHSKSVLIGIVRAYIPYTDVAISQQTQQARIIFQENSGLADVVPVDRITDTIREFLRIEASLSRPMVLTPAKK